MADICMVVVLLRMSILFSYFFRNSNFPLHQNNHFLSSNRDAGVIRDITSLSIEPRN